MQHVFEKKVNIKKIILDVNKKKIQCSAIQVNLLCCAAIVKNNFPGLILFMYWKSFHNDEKLKLAYICIYYASVSVSKKHIIFSTCCTLF